MRRPLRRLAGSALVTIIAATAASACDGLRAADTPEGEAALDAGETRPDGSSGPRRDAASVVDDDAGAAPDADAGPPRAVEILADKVTKPVGLALTDDTVFYALNGDPDSVVRKVKKDGTSAEIVDPYEISSGLNPLGSDVVVLGGEVFWVNATALVGVIQAAPVAGGAVRTVKKSIDRPYHLAMFGDELFWVDESFTPSTYAIYRMPATGGAGTKVESGQIRVGGIAVDSTGVYWTHAGPLAPGNQGGVRRHDPAGTKDLYVGADNGDVGGLALGSKDVFWADTDTGRVLKVAKVGGAAKVLAGALSSPKQVALDGAHVYFTQFGVGTNHDGKVSRVPIDGGPVEDLVTGLDHPLGIALDATHVYWSSYGGGEVARVAK